MTGFLVYIFVVAFPAFILGDVILDVLIKKKYTRNRFFFCQVLGTGVLGQIFFVTALIWKIKLTFWITFIFLIYFIRAKKIPVYFKNIKKFSGEFFRDGASVYKNIFLLFFLAVIIFSIPGIMAPPVFFDALERHLSFAGRYVERGHFYPIRESILSAVPQLQQMLFSLVLLFKSILSTKWIHFHCFILSILGTYHLGKRLGGSDDTGWLAATIFMLVPKALITSTMAGVDMSLVMFDIAAFLSLLSASHHEGSDRSMVLWSITGGIFTGFSLSVKYTGLFSFFLITLIILIFLERRNKIKSCVIYIFTALIISSPWWINNLVYYQNPLFPFFENVLHPENHSAINALVRLKEELNKFGWFGGEPLFVSRILSVIRVHFYFYPYDGYTGLMFILTLPFILIYRTNKKQILPVYIYAGLYLVLWCASTNQVRFLLPVFPFLAVISAAVIKEIQSYKSSLKKSLNLIWIIAAIFQLLFFVWESQHFFKYYTYLFNPDKRAYLTARTGVYPAIEYINNNIDKGERVILLGESRGFYLKNDYIAQTRFDDHPLIEWVSAARDSRDILTILRGKKIRYILINMIKINRLEHAGVFRWKTKRDVSNFRAFWNEYTQTVFNRYPYLVLELTG